jgi:hypothetical protein
VSACPPPSTPSTASCRHWHQQRRLRSSSWSAARDCCPSCRHLPVSIQTKRLVLSCRAHRQTHTHTTTTTTTHLSINPRTTGQPFHTGQPHSDQHLTGRLPRVLDRVGDQTEDVLLDPLPVRDDERTDGHRLDLERDGRVCVVVADAVQRQVEGFLEREGLGSGD